MSDATHGELAALRERVERLEALEACRNRFHEYLYYLDGGYIDELLALFVTDARLELRNFPPGTGENPQFVGLEEIRGLYEPFVGEGARHHSANVAAVASEALDRVEMTAYFHTSLEYALTGGVYEIQLRPGESGWQITRLRISSTWGWNVPHTDPAFLKTDFAAGTLRGGRPPGLRGDDWE